MQCNHPRWLHQHQMYVPCGKCMACRISRTTEWTTRIMHEMDNHESSIFVTLTYADEALPVSGNLSKDELQRFFKRLRKRLEPRKVKYYACGEYGSQTKRPHYHAIIFGLSIVEHETEVRHNPDGKKYIACLSGPLVDAWKLGFVSVGTVTYDSARYTAKYIQKQLSGEQAVYGEKIIQPFQLVSNGLGKDYAMRNKAQLSENLYTTHNGVKVGLPKYYQKLLEIPSERLLLASQERNKEVGNVFTNKLQKKGFDAETKLSAEDFMALSEVKKREIVFEEVKRSRIQKEKNIKARQEINK